MLLRLRQYGAEIMGRFTELMNDPTLTPEQAALTRRIESDIVRLATIILYFNQPIEDCPLELWVEQTPQPYREKLLRSLALLQETLFWTKVAIAKGEDEAIKIDYLDALRIESLDPSALHSSFAVTCRKLHELIPRTIYLKFALIRLIKAYEESREAIAMAQDLTSCDRLAYLKRISRPIH